MKTNGKRIMVAGIKHETHSFLAQPTLWSDFTVLRGEEIFSARGNRMPLDGFLTAAARHGWDVVPLIHAVARPSGPVDEAVFDEFWAELEPRARAALAQRVDAMFIILHGAMATASWPDFEGEILSRLRRLPGLENLPVFGVMDPHGNITERMTTHADSLVAYRENPHTDAFDAAVRAADLLARCLELGRRPRMLWLRPPMVWPPPATASAEDPLRSLLARAREFENAIPGLWCVNLCGGFSYADCADTGFSLSAVVDGDAGLARAALCELGAEAWRQRERSRRDFPTPEEVLAKILPVRDGPVVLVEPSDNIGGGAPGDATGLLRSLMRCRVESALVAINDPDVAAECHRRGAGTTARLAVGGKLSPFDEGPVEAEWQIVSVSDGKFDLEDPQSHLATLTGVHVNMGSSAVLRHGHTSVLVTTRATPPFDLGQFRSQGLDPATFKIVGVKAAIGHRRAYDKIRKAEFHVETPGACTTNLSRLPFKNLKRPVYPLDPACEWTPAK